MKKLDTSAITDSSQLKIKKGTLQFLQDANYEMFNAIVRGAIGASFDNSKVYILYGCVNTGDGNSYNISEGAIFYQGEVYLVDAAIFNTSGASVAIFTQVTSQYTNNADPMTFSDSSVHNVHDIRKMVISSGVSGAGISNWTSRASFSFSVEPQINITATGALTKNGVYPNIILDVPLNNNRNKILFAGTLNIGNLAADTVSFNVSFPDIGTANYYVMGSIVSNPSSNNFPEDTTTMWTIHARTSSGFVFVIHEIDHWTQDISFEYIIFAK